jgi:hypothetical protein
MIDLERFFQNPFVDVRISDDELQAFSEDHLAKLTAANEGGEFDGRITDTTAKFLGFFDHITGQELKVALLKAATGTMNQRWSDLVGYMTVRGEARIIDRAGKPSALYTQFYPRGKSEFHEAKITDALALASRVSDLATANVALLGQDFVDAVTQLTTDFTNARAAQMSLKGEKSDVATDRRAGKAALALQLFDNLLLLAMRHKEQPEMEASYFDQSLLEDRKRPQPAPAMVAAVAAVSG